jgi:sugar-specific transcriptional regulator TrmB/DNA-binding CsgD family transcriptional regulator
MRFRCPAGCQEYATADGGLSAVLRHVVYPPYWCSTLGRRNAILLDVLGLSAEESLAYRELVAVPSTTPAELAARVGVKRTAALRLLSALEQKGLAARSGEDTTRFVPTPPSVALGAMLVERQNEVRLAELELGSLDEIYRAAAADRAAADVVDVVEGKAGIRRRFEQLQLAANDEVMAFMTAPTAVISAAEHTVEDEAVARGVRYRLLFERAMLDDEPGTYDQIAGAVAAGEQIRVTDSLPLKLLIVDHELALVPIGSAESPAEGALLVRKSGLLDALEALFEAEWSRSAEMVVSAGEIGEIAPDAIDDVDAQLLSLLLAGLNDKAVAYQLGTSLRTVQRRVSHLMDLARVETRMQLGWQAARLGWSPSSSVTSR